MRLKDFDYSTPGYYFVTVCTHNRRHYFGSVINDYLSLTPAGRMVSETIEQCQTQFSSVSVDSFVVMPNHIHVLFGLAVRLDDEPGKDNLSDMVHWLKSTVHQRFRLGVMKHNWEAYDRLVWQEGFHDHIVRDEQEFETLRAYILTNVGAWEKDRFYDGFVG